MNHIEAYQKADSIRDLMMLFYCLQRTLLLQHY